MELPAIPRVKLAVIEGRVAAILTALLQDAPAAWDYTRCRRLASAIHYILDNPGVTLENLFQTLVQYTGRQVDYRWVEPLAWQLAARTHELQVSPLQPYERPVRNEWVPLEIFKTEPTAWRDNKPGQLITLFCMLGHPAGHRLRKKFPEAWLAFLAYRIGYTRRVQYERDPKELVGFRFWGYLKIAQPGAPDDLDFEDWQVDKQTKQHNVAILRLRKRFDVDLEKVSEDNIEQYSCPFGYDHYCSSCRQPAARCIAAPNRERGDARGPLVDGAPTGDPEPG